LIGGEMNKNTKRILYKMICRLPWAISVIGVILASIGLYVLFTLPHIGKPIDEVIQREDRKTTTIRYWETEEQVKLAKKRNDEKNVGAIILAGGILLFIGGIGLHNYLDD
jgi:hypothetical protein